MFVLFLESKAAQQIRDYCADHPEHFHTLEETLQRCYDNGKLCDYSECDEAGWVTKCLREDGHKDVNVDMMFTWSDTPEGRGYWSSIQGDDGW